VIEGYTVSAELPQIKVTVGAALPGGMLLTADDRTEVDSLEALQTVINSATEDINIKLSDSYSTTTGTLTIGGAVNVTLDLNGKTIDGGADTCITHNGSGNLTIQNGNVLANTSVSSAAIQLTSSGGFILKDVMVENFNGYGFISSKDSSGDVTIQGGKVIAGKNAAISMEGQGKLDVSGATLERDLYGVFITYRATTPTVTIGGGTYIRNYDSFGSAISFLSDNTTLILKSCTIYAEGYAVDISEGSGTFKIQSDSPVILQAKYLVANQTPDLP